jgi:hypothetical protein
MRHGQPVQRTPIHANILELMPEHTPESAYRNCGWNMVFG